MANNTLNLTSLDPPTLKLTFLSWLASQPIFNGYNFEGSNWNVLIDILIRNDYLLNLYLNFRSSEAFLDTCQEYDSASYHAEELNYTPRSSISAFINVSIVINTGNSAQTSFFMPKYTSFTGRIGSNLYFFTSNSNITAVSTNNIVTAANITLYEGSIVTESFIVDYSNTYQAFTLSNPGIDTTSLQVIVNEANTFANETFFQVDTLFGLNANSLIYFVEPAMGGLYKIRFGDNIIGKIPDDQSVVTVTYRNTSGELPNCVTNLSTPSLIDGFSNIQMTILGAACGGNNQETIASIKYNAPRSFKTQERAVVYSDYETLLLDNFSEIRAVHAYGGETVYPPQYGKVFIVLNITGIDGLPTGKINDYTNFLNARSVAKNPIFIAPDYLYLKIYCTVNYDDNLTTTDESGIQAEVIAAILDFNKCFLDTFNANFYYSKFVTAISNTDPSIVSNETEVTLIKQVTPTISNTQMFTISFGQAISPGSISSTPFVSNGHIVSVTSVAINATAGSLAIIDSQSQVSSNAGLVDFSTGLLNLSIKSDDLEMIKVYANSATLDVLSNQNIIINILPQDVVVIPVVNE